MVSLRATITLFGVSGISFGLTPSNVRTDAHTIRAQTSIGLNQLCIWKTTQTQERIAATKNVAITRICALSLRCPNANKNIASINDTALHLSMWSEQNGSMIHWERLTPISLKYREGCTLLQAHKDLFVYPTTQRNSPPNQRNKHVQSCNQWVVGSTYD